MLSNTHTNYFKSSVASYKKWWFHGARDRVAGRKGRTSDRGALAARAHLRRRQVDSGTLVRGDRQLLGSNQVG